MKVAYAIHVLALSLICGIAAFQLAQFVQTEVVQNQLEKDADRIGDVFEARLRRSESTVNAAGSLISVFGSLDVTRFRQFASSLATSNNGLRSIAWAPRVTDQARVRVELSAELDGVRGFSIVETADGNRRPAQRRGEYFPIYFLESLDTDRSAVGYDLGSHDASRAALAMARDAGSAVVGEGLVPAPVNLPTPRLFLISPVYQGVRPPDDIAVRREKLKGFAIGELQIADLVESSLSHLPAPDAYEVSLFSLNGERTVRLFPHDETRTQTATRESTHALATTGMQRRFDFGGSEWRLDIRPADPVILGALNPYSWLAFFLAALVTLPLGAFLTNLVQGRRVAEERTRELWRSELDFQSLAQWAPVGIFRSGPGGEVTYFNKQLLEIADLSEAEVLGNGWHQALHPDQREATAIEWNEAARERRQYRREQVYLKKDGSSSICFVQATPIVSEQGDLLGHVGTVTDVSAQRRAEQALEQTHQRLINSMNSIRNGFAIWDADDRLVLANDAYKSFHAPISGAIEPGLDFKTLLAKGFDSGFWDTGDEDKDVWLETQLKRRKQRRNGEKELCLSDGRELVFAQTVMENGDTITSVIDVTAHRKREKELESTKEELERIAFVDNLTGLANRAQCQRDMVQEIFSTDPDHKFAIVQIDLDKFKWVNDTLGHAAGDYLLRTLGERLRQFGREFPGFRTYRWGGDEFIALVHSDDGVDIATMCEELTDVIAIPVDYEGTTLRPTVSLGVARYPEDARDLEALMIFADLALYKTKELGRDGFQFFTSEMKEKVDSEALIEQELRVALANDQLALYYQPQIGIEDERVTGIEALVRWNHPERGVISPGSFLPILESSGLAATAGRQLFDRAMRSIRHWVDAEIQFGRLAINLSPEHFKQGTILNDLFDAMARHSVEPEHITVEFLESLVLDAPNSNVETTLQELRDRGIRVELDDFGTGYASLSHLSEMPINGLKIDRSFVSQVVDNPKYQGIISSLVSMSRLMDLHVVCEGVETQQQVDALSKLADCSVQGYFVARPMGFEDITDWLREGRNIGLLHELPDAKMSGSYRAGTQVMLS